MNSERSDFRIELVSALILSLAVVLSAWSASQSSLWSGIQAFRLADSHLKSRNAMEKAILFGQNEIVDAEIAMQVINAVAEDKPEIIEFYLKRLRPELKLVFTKWIESNPKKNPEAYRQPFLMPEYIEIINRARLETVKLREDAERIYNQAEEANENSDVYTLMTAMASVILFVGGVESKFKQKKIRKMLLIFAGWISLFVSYKLLNLPVTFG